jgi:hypothetical protein
METERNRKMAKDYTFSPYTIILIILDLDKNVEMDLIHHSTRLGMLETVKDKKGP